MKKANIALLLLIMIASTFIVSPSVMATSWGYVEPREVVNRADVIVIGKFDFSGPHHETHDFFAGYSFDVKQVYKGDVPRRIVAGIDGSDVGVATKFQEEGSEFLLLLQRSEDTDLLIPVSGSNGTIVLTGGKVDERYQEEVHTFYRGFLSGQTPIATYQSNSRPYIYWSIGIVGCFIAAWMIYRLVTKKKLT